MRTYFGVDRSDYELVKGYVFAGYVDCPIAQEQKVVLPTLRCVYPKKPENFTQKSK